MCIPSRVGAYVITCGMLTGLLAACGDGLDVASPTPVANVGGVAAPRNLDERFAALAQKVPGFAGFYFDGSVPIVNLVDLSRAEEARVLVTELLNARAPHPLRPVSSQMEFRTARFAYDELKRWYDKIDGLWDSYGVVYTDISDRENVIVVGVSSELSVGPMLATFHAYGIPSAALRVFVSQPAIALQKTLNDSVRPIMAGFRIGLADGGGDCSNALTVRRPNDSNLYVLTASHCTTQWAVYDGGAWYQYSETLGNEAYDATYAYCSYLCIDADAVLLRYNNAVNGAFAAIPRPTGLGSNSVDELNPIPVVGSEADVYEGEGIEALGRVSGYHSGTVWTACANVLVERKSDHAVRKVLCANQPNWGLLEGDSGGSVFYSGWPWNHDTDYAIFIGVQFASGGWFSALGQIEQELGTLVVY